MYQRERSRQGEGGAKRTGALLRCFIEHTPPHIGQDIIIGRCSAVQLPNSVLQGWVALSSCVFKAVQNTLNAGVVKRENEKFSIYFVTVPGFFLWKTPGSMCRGSTRATLRYDFPRLRLLLEYTWRELASTISV